MLVVHTIASFEQRRRITRHASRSRAPHYIHYFPRSPARAITWWNGRLALLSMLRCLPVKPPTRPFLRRH